MYSSFSHPAHSWLQQKLAHTWLRNSILILWSRWPTYYYKTSKLLTKMKLGSRRRCIEYAPAWNAHLLNNFEMKTVALVQTYHSCEYLHNLGNCFQGEALLVTYEEIVDHLVLRLEGRKTNLSEVIENEIDLRVFSRKDQI